ncbi:MAG: hypothetical protein ACETWG_11800, partial [Candidatus Neomarinimicrobiota bacterium]
MLALILGLTDHLYAWQADTLDQVHPLPDTAGAQTAEVYAPGPVLSPSTDYLFFEELLPGESRTLFMDLANLGEGLIRLDSLTFPERIVQVTLPFQTLRPGQFVRFPVTYTQVDLDTHDLEVIFHWASPQYNVTNALVIALNATPRPPLQVTPSVLLWPVSYAGSKRTDFIQLQNIGTLPITFPAKPSLPPEVQLSPVPQIMPGESSVMLKVSWWPTSAGLLDSRIRLPYRVGEVVGEVAIGLQGEALQPAYFVEDTLNFGHVFAGSSYRRRVAVGNGSGETVVLRRVNLGEGDEESTAIEGGGGPTEWIETPAELEVEPGATAYLEVVFSPRSMGLYLAAIPFSQQLKPDRGAGPGSLPDILLTIRAEVSLPLSVSIHQVDFGPQPVLLTAMRPLEVENRGASAVSFAVELAAGREVFSFPPLVFSLAPGDTLDIPLYFRPREMQDYKGAAVLRYSTFDEPQELPVTFEGRGLDRPLLRLEVIPDLTIQEDFPGWYPVADLTRVFDDANHQVSYRLFHPFGQGMQLVVEPDGHLMVAGTPDYHGIGEVVVQAVNELGHVVADTFRLAVTAVNDLPRLAAPIPDIVLREDPGTVVLGRLSEIFVDPDRALDTVVTHYTIYTPATDDAVRLAKEGDELVLTVAPDWHGSRSFVIAARDAGDTSVVVFDAFKVTILAENDPPAISVLPTLELVEDEIVRLDWRRYIRDVDHSHAELTLSFTTADGGPLPLAFVGAGELTTDIRPQADWFGELIVRMTVSDPGGGAASRDFAVNVTPVNDPPGAFRLIEPMILEYDQRIRYAGRDTLVTFRWEPSPNLDPGDDLLYTWQLLDTTGRRVLQELPAGPATDVMAYLDSAGIFLWTVVVRDGQGATATSDTLPLLLEALGAAIP